MNMEKEELSEELIEEVSGGMDYEIKGSFAIKLKCAKCGRSFGFNGKIICPYCKHVNHQFLAQ